MFIGGIPLQKFGVVLNQLRSGYSRVLNSYLHRIDEEKENKCTNCNTSPHNTNHLFNCQLTININNIEKLSSKKGKRENATKFGDTNNKFISFDLDSTSKSHYDDKQGFFGILKDFFIKVISQYFFTLP